MISFSDVKKYVNDAPAVMKFKPWWEICLDLLLAGLFMIMILAWTRSYSVEAGGLACVPQEGDVPNFATAEIRYVHSRCYMESSVSKVEFYPYILFIQWCIMFLCQISWVWIPSVNAKFIYFYNIFNDITLVDPTFVFNPNNYGMLPEIDYTDENRAKLKVIHDKITFMLMDKNYLSTIYRRKSYILTVVIFICILIIILWLSLVSFLQSDFSCKLEAGDGLKESPLVACNISPQIYIYGIMLLHALILLLMFALSIKSIIWHVRMSFRVRDSSDKLFGELADDYKGLPGYEDLAIILELFSVNVCDGHFIMNVIMYVLTSRYDHRRPIIVKNNTAIAIKNKKNIIHSFWEEYCIVNYIVSEIGLVITNYEQTQDTLFNFLNKLCETQKFTCFSVGFNAKAEICREISRNISYYSYLAESDKNLPPLLPGSTCNLDSYSVINKIDRIMSKNEWPDHLILQASSNAFKIKIILISAYTPVENDLFSREVFKPFDTDSIKSTIVLVYITPYYYYSVEDQKNRTTAQESNKLDYLRHSRYRDRLRQNAMRKVGALNTNDVFKNKVHKEKIDRFKHKTVIDPNVQLTDTSYFTTHHIPPKSNTSEPKIIIDDNDETPVQTNSILPRHSFQNVNHSLNNNDNNKK